jgi:hypothetical protein
LPGFAGGGCASTSGAPLHTLAVPLPPHVCGGMHAPHDVTVREAPQLSDAVTVPHVFPSRAQKVALFSATHEHVFVAPHVCGAVHEPHEATVRAVPQLSVLVTAPQV